MIVVNESGTTRFDPKINGCANEEVAYTYGVYGEEEYSDTRSPMPQVTEANTVRMRWGDG